MLSHLDTLPSEIEACILKHLHYQDLVNLERTSKHFYNVIVPILWNEIEIHRPGLHEQILFEETFDYRTVLTSCRARNYVHSTYPDVYYRLDQQYAEMAMSFLRTFDPPTGSDFGLVENAHRKQVAERLRSVCMDVNLDADDWGEETAGSVGNLQNLLLIFSQFQNLESLDLTIQWPYSSGRWDRSVEAFVKRKESIHHLTKLRALHLRGYVPQAFVEWACYAANQLVDLELAVLDRPIGSTLCEKKRPNPPINPKGGSDQRTGNADSPLDIEDSDSEVEDFNEEQIAPRSLATLSHTDIPEQLKSLSNLILRRPATSAMHEDGVYHFYDMYTSLKSEESILAEWARLIRATRATIKHLVFDQRLVAEDIEEDCTSPTQFLVIYAYGPGYRKFEDIVLPALLEDAEWPQLQSIRLYGFEVTDDLSTKYSASNRSNTFAKCSFLPRLKERFKPSDVDIATGIGRRLLFDHITGMIHSGGDGFGTCDPTDL